MFRFPDAIDIIIAVAEEHDFSVDTQMIRDTTPNPLIPDSLAVENLPFVHLVGTGGTNNGPFAVQDVQARVYSTSEITSRDAARLFCDLLSNGPQDGGDAGVVDRVQATSPVMVDSGYANRVQHNAMLSCDLRAL